MREVQMILLGFCLVGAVIIGIVQLMKYYYFKKEAELHKAEIEMKWRLREEYSKGYDDGFTQGFNLREQE